MKKIFTLVLFGSLFAGGVLHAEAVFNCNKCDGSGRIRVCRTIKCRSCAGIKIRCASCKGTGQAYFPTLYGMSRDTCISCLGSGRTTCYTCVNSGTQTVTGSATCPQCKGRGKFTL